MFALFVWRKFRDKSGQQGVNCAVFRNEGPYLSSELILEAEQIAWRRWLTLGFAQCLAPGCTPT